MNEEESKHESVSKEESGPKRSFELLLIATRHIFPYLQEDGCVDIEALLQHHTPQKIFQFIPVGICDEVKFELQPARLHGHGVAEVLNYLKTVVHNDPLTRLPHAELIYRARFCTPDTGRFTVTTAICPPNKPQLHTLSEIQKLQTLFAFYNYVQDYCEKLKCSYYVFINFKKQKTK